MIYSILYFSVSFQDSVAISGSHEVCIVNHHTGIHWYTDMTYSKGGFFRSYSELHLA